MITKYMRFVVLGTAMTLLAACSGGSGAPRAGAGAGGGSENFSNPDQFFAARVQPQMDFCRTCHIPQGAGDTDAGRRMMLSTDRSRDRAMLEASWQALGGNNPVSRILTMASAQEAHTGGAPWPQTSDAYKDVAVMLACFETPDDCMRLISSRGTGSTDVGSLPLLGPVYSRGTRQLFCEGPDGNTPRPDSAVLPQDAREKIVPGVNEGKAVHFNAYWENCKVGLPASDQAPKTCGEYRKLRDEGGWLLNVGMGLNGGRMTAEEFNDSWRNWGLTERPANFDAMYTLRYGTNQPNFRNPYPVRKADGTMEDPNAPGVDGGSGQLPIGMTQLKDENGQWTGQLVNQSTNCAGCHGGQIGLPGEHPVAGAWWGIPNNNIDPIARSLDSDGSQEDLLLNSVLGFGVFSGPRGLNDASTGYELLAYVLTDWDSNDLRPDISKHPFAHGRAWQDSPSWFHQAHQPRKFKSGEISVNAHRMTAAACLPPGGFNNPGAEVSAYRDYCGQRLAAFQESLEAPDWPESLRPIDIKLAEQGAILFHSKDLWAHPGNEGIPRPEGNGSCAGCHGAYSPRYVNDPTFLESPELEGMASYIVPMEIIGAEPYRHNMTTTDFAETWNQSWWSYPEGKPGYVAPADKTPLQEVADDNRSWALAGQEPVGACQWAQTSTQGYLAPALHGIWATGPYMHNGSVPTIEQMLDSSTRPTIWRRKMQRMGPVEGFDQSFATGYDFDRIGWKHDELKCEDYPNDPNLRCNPADPQGPPLGTLLTDLLQGRVLWSGLLHPQYRTNPELRFIYDTRHTGSGNEGHAFADILTPTERKAILEYLKTL